MEKKITINGKHKEKLAAELEKLQHRCTARTLTVGGIESILSETERKLGVSKKALTGTVLTYTGAQPFPRAYKYQPESTHFTAEFNGRHWVILEISRDDCPNRDDDTTLQLSDGVKEALLKQFSSFWINTFHSNSF